MASVYGNSPISWSANTDEKGYRTYNVTYRVKSETTESIAAVMVASGLPAVGSTFSITGFTGNDQWVWCRPELQVSVDQEKKGDPGKFYLVQCKFSNKPRARCWTTTIQNPLMEPMKVSGGFNKQAWEAKYDMYGNRLVTSANEPITGPEVTFSYARPTIRIQQNVATLGLSTISSMINTVNSASLWGLPARCVLLNNLSWERKVYGTCSYYYTRSFDFEIDYYNHTVDGTILGFDKEIFDSGSQCLRGQWVTDTSDTHYGAYKLLSSITSTAPSGTGTAVEKLEDIPEGDIMAFKDMNFENARVMLDGYGRPANTKIINSNDEVVVEDSGPPERVRFKFYRESNFLLLGIPTTF